jgi:hypothetical protein
MQTTYDIRRAYAIAPTNLGVYAQKKRRQASAVLDTDRLLAELDNRNIRNVDIARVLDLPDSRIPEIRKKKRAIKLDEAAKLVEAFGLEQNPPVAALGPQVARLMVQHFAVRMGVKVDWDSPQARELLGDLEAFGRFVADPQVRESIEASEMFFRAMQLRPQAVAVDQPETGHHAKH